MNPAVRKSVCGDDTNLSPGQSLMNRQSMVNPIQAA
jgi:hypothetical protein